MKTKMSISFSLTKSENRVSFCSVKMRLIHIILAALMIVTLAPSCKHQRVCAGLNSTTGTANSPKKARRSMRGSTMRSPGEFAARDRQRQRLKSKKSRSKTSSGGLKGKGRGYKRGFSFRIRIGKGSASASGTGGVKF
jgi:hypothetical protein